MAINGIHHVAVSTQDMERSLAFYQKLLGAQICFDGGWPQGTELADTVTRLKDSSCRQVMLRIGNAYLEIFQYHSPTPNPVDPARLVCDHGWTHLCLDVTDVDSEYQRLLAAGVETHSEPQWVADGVKTLYVRDPDGNVLEMQEVFPDTESEAVIGIPAFTPKES